MLTKEKIQTIVTKSGAGARDSGNSASQIAVLTERINDLQGHFKGNPKDYSSRRGLLQLVGHRRRLLAYLRRKDPKRYVDLLRELNLRK